MASPSTFPSAATRALADAVTPARPAFRLRKPLAANPVHFAEPRQNAHKNKEKEDDFENHEL